MKRHNLILTIILAVQIILSVVVFWPRAAATGGTPLIANLKVDDIAALIITDDQGNTIALRRGSGGEWGLPGADDYPADADKVTPLLEKIVQIKIDQPVTRTDASHGQLQVAGDDFMRRILIETTAGTGYTLYLGTSPQYGATHVRLDGQDEAYLTSELSAWDVSATASSWIDTTYFVLEQNELAQVTLENANGTFTFVNTLVDVPSEEQDVPDWTLVGIGADEQLADSEIKTTIGKGTWVTMIEPLGTEEQADYGLTEPLATVEIQKGDGAVTILYVGAQDPVDKSYVVKVTESPYYARVADYNITPLVDRVRDDFIAQPTPTPEEAAPTPEG